MVKRSFWAGLHEVFLPPSWTESSPPQSYPKTWLSAPSLAFQLKLDAQRLFIALKNT